MSADGDPGGGDKLGALTNVSPPREAGVVISVLSVSVASWDSSDSSWRDGYPNLLQQHLAGLDPGFGEDRWNPAWTREEFDVQHLAQARRLTQKACVNEKALNKAFAICKNLGLEALEWQISQFSNQRHYYTESQEAALIASPPAATIHEWGERLPASPGE